MRAGASGVVHTKPVIQVSGPCEVRVGAGPLGRRFRLASVVQTETMLTVEGKEYALASCAELRLEAPHYLVLVFFGHPHAPLWVRPRDASARRWANLLAQWISFLRQMPLAQIFSETPAGGAVVFASLAAKQFSGVWDEDLHLRLRGRVLQFHRSPDDDDEDVLGYVMLSAIASVALNGERLDGVQRFQLTVHMRGSSEAPWFLAVETERLAEEWRRLLTPERTNKLQSTITFGKGVGRKLQETFKARAREEPAAAEAPAVKLSTPYNVRHEQSILPTRNAGLDNEEGEPEAFDSYSTSVALPEHGDLQIDNLVGDSEYGGDYDNVGQADGEDTGMYIDTSALHLHLEEEISSEDPYDTLQAPDIEAPTPGGSHADHSSSQSYADYDANYAGEQYEEDDEFDDNLDAEFQEMDTAVFESKDVAFELSKVLSVCDTSTGEMDLLPGASDDLQSEDLITLNESLAEFLEGGDVSRLRRLTKIESPQSREALLSAVRKSASIAGLRPAQAAFRLREGLEAAQDDEQLIDYSSLPELPPRPTSVPGEDRPIARANARALLQAHKARSMMGEGCPVPRSSKRPTERPTARAVREEERQGRQKKWVSAKSGSSPSAAAPPPLPPKPKAVPKKGRSPPPSSRQSKDKKKPTSPRHKIDKLGVI